MDNNIKNLKKEILQSLRDLVLEKGQYLHVDNDIVGSNYLRDTDILEFVDEELSYVK